MEVITSRQNPLLQKLRKLNGSNSFRRQQGLFVCEGPKLLEEAVKWGVSIETVVKEPEFELPQGLSCRVVETPYEVLRSVTDTVTPQQVLFTCRLPDTALPDKLEKGRYLVLDGVQDPGNLGTVWRTADAFGAAGLLLTGPCGEPFAPKAVRASMGACFRLPVWRGEREVVAGLLKRSGVPLYATALREDTEDVRKADLSQAAVVIGSEGKGISEEMLSLCEKTLKIPMEEKCESLNAAVAAAVVLWEGYCK
ncbi:MAG: RNA methyltransferase [Oscillospiraceae bacterium]|nr:RNA methyltransferase [Oscillospiraceae bacterium]